MGSFSAKDALRVPSLLSLTRLPLAWLFCASIQSPRIALAVLLIAGASDVVDGWYARHFGQATATGAVIDGVTDKAFMSTVVLSLLLTGKLDLLGAVLLATRELGELPLVVWWVFHRDKRKARADNPRANRVGKLCTSVQFLAVTGALFDMSWLHATLWSAGALGVLAAGYYWHRETR